MKRSEINRAYREAGAGFAAAGWHLPPDPEWDITDFGLGRFDRAGLTLVNLATEPEYCEKLMWARRNQVTPFHAHRRKKEDIICRSGRLTIELWVGHPERTERGTPGVVGRNREPTPYRSGDRLELEAGERVTLEPGIYHSFWPVSSECVIGEVSTVNDDDNDNFFVDPDIGRFPDIDEDEPAEVNLPGD